MRSGAFLARVGMTFASHEGQCSPRTAFSPLRRIFAA